MNFNYTETIYEIIYVKEGKNLGKCRNVQEAIQIINKFLRGNNIIPRNYVITEKDNFTQLKNGENIFHLYKIK